MTIYTQASHTPLFLLDTLFPVSTYLKGISFRLLPCYSLPKRSMSVDTPTKHMQKGLLGVDMEMHRVLVCVALARVIHIFALFILGGRTFTVPSPRKMMQQMVAHTAREPISCGDLCRHKHNPCPMLINLKVLSSVL